MAITLDFDKVNSDLYTLDTLFSTAQLSVFTVTTFQSALTADTQATEADPIVIGTARQVANELNAMLFEVNAGGTIAAFVMDGHHVDAATLQIRLRNVLGDATLVVTKEDTLGGLLA